jgi:23S rRNA (uracil1939-C5)-methyltransferase
MVVLDPPRGGCSPKALEAVIKSGARTVVYVSCNPEPLARDLKALSAHYKIEAVQPVDMFPQTNHVEVVTKLKRS